MTPQIERRTTLGPDNLMRASTVILVIGLALWMARLDWRTASMERNQREYITRQALVYWAALFQERLQSRNPELAGVVPSVPRMWTEQEE